MILWSLIASGCTLAGFGTGFVLGVFAERTDPSMSK